MRSVRVCDLSKRDLERIRNARQEHGNKIYGDRDKYRDGCLDMVEEVLDVKNILNRRMFHISSDIKKDKYGLWEYYYEINKQCDNLLETFKEFDNYIRNVGIEVDDTNGGTRIGLDKIK